jgi:integrase
MAIRKRSNRRLPYLVYWRNPHTKKLEAQSFATLGEAREHDSDVQHRLKFKPETFPGLGQQKPIRQTFMALFVAYLRDKRFDETNARHTTNHVMSMAGIIGNLDPADITKAVLRLVVEHLANPHKDSKGNLRPGLKQNGINRRISIVKSVLAWAEGAELITVNHSRSFECARGMDAKTPPPTPAEIRKILEAAPGHLRRVIILGYYLGARVGPSELFRLRWEDFDLERERVRIRNARKGAKVPWREVDVRPEILPMLRSWREDGHEYVIHYEDRLSKRGQTGTKAKKSGKPYIQSIKHAWASTLARAEITRPITPYDLRHSFATFALEAGSDLKAVAEIMGHASTAMIHKHYQHVLNRQKRAVIESLPTIESGHTDRSYQDGLNGGFGTTSGKNIQ